MMEGEDDEELQPMRPLEFDEDPSQSTNCRSQRNHRQNPRNRIQLWIGLSFFWMKRHLQKPGSFMAVVMVLLLVIVPAFWMSHASSTEQNGNLAALPVQYECPSTFYFSKVAMLKEDPSRSWYLDEKSEGSMTPDGIQQFMKDFRNQTFDGWTKTYNEVKEGNTMIVKKWFSRHVKSGSSIYESACGVGLNLYMSAEILQEQVDPTLQDVYVYGNEYIPENAQRANVLWDHAPPSQGGFQKGILCAGDSTKLRDFVPADSFDLVYSGYIEPLIDPLFLVLNEGLTYKERDKYYSEWCVSTFRLAQILSRAAQKRQDEWFVHWIDELIRIAKPGAGIILEQVSGTVCEDPDNWGGVMRTLFNEESIIQNYWDVDPDSVEFLDATVIEGRTHVYMRKNPA